MCHNSTYPPESAEARHKSILTLPPEKRTKAKRRKRKADGADSGRAGGVGGRVAGRGGGVGGGGGGRVKLQVTLRCCQWRVEDKEKEE